MIWVAGTLCPPYLILWITSKKFRARVQISLKLVIAANGGVVRSEDIKNHELTRNITQPTFHRSLKSLVSQGLLSHAPNTKAGSYISPEGVRAPMPAELSAIV